MLGAQAIELALTLGVGRSEEVNNAFAPHMPILRALHKKYCKFKSKVQQLKAARMSLGEWIKMLSDANMFNDVRVPWSTTGAACG